MESQDVFGQGTDIKQDDDPFAGSDFGDFGDTETGTPPAEPSNGAAAQAPAPAPAPAVPAGPPTLSPEQRHAEAVAYAQTHGEPEPAPLAQQRVEPANEGGLPDGTPSPLQPQPTTDAESEHAAQQARLRAIAEREAAAKATAAETAPQAAVEAAPDPTQSSSVSSAPADTPVAASGEDDAEEDAPVPPEVQSPSGKTTKRRYVVLQITSPGKFEQVSWYEKDGKMCERGPGAKRQTIAVVSGAEDALRIGYAAVGSPAKAHLVAVAALHFQPRVIEPEIPEPSRVRLKIS